MQGTRISDHVDYTHFHNCIEIALCENGSMTWNLENTYMQVNAGDFLFCRRFIRMLPFSLPRRTPMYAVIIFFLIRRSYYRLFTRGDCLKNCSGTVMRISRKFSVGMIFRKKPFLFSNFSTVAAHVVRPDTSSLPAIPVCSP